VDKKNLIAFLSLSLAVLIGWNLLFPPAQRPKPQEAAQQQAADGEEGAQAAGGGQLGVGPEQADKPDEAEDEEAADLETVPAVPLEYATLGSLDRTTGYRMLVTLTNRGAAVQRAELSSPRFLDLNDRSGYLGHLEFAPTAHGLEVQVVGAGTPAQAADLRVGDVITGIQLPKRDLVTVKTIDEFETERKRSRAGQELTLTVLREDSPQQVTVKTVRRPLEVMRPEIENIHMRNGTVPEGFVDPPSFLVSMSTLQGVALGKREVQRLNEWFEEGTWSIADRTDTSVSFERPLPAENLKLVKRFTLEPVPEGSRDDRNYPGYNIRLDVAVENTGEAEQSVAYRLDGPTGLPLEGWWYTHKISQRWFSSAGLRDVVVRFFGAQETQIDCATIAEDKAAPMGQGAALAFVGVDAVYFSAVMIPLKKSLEENWLDSTEAIRVGPRPDARTPVRFTNVSCRMTRTPVLLAPGQRQEDSYIVFIGPKRPELLAQYQAAGDPNYSLRDIIYYGMWPFGAVARGMLAILHFFYSIVGNFGIAIIMLTVLVRGCMFPISFKQTKNMARMQALKPELDKINEKYKTDMQKRSQAMQELYRKHQINPLGGCLPVFLQLPIFMGLYRSIMIDVELRQQPLFSESIRWVSDLAAPDMLYNWSWFMPEFVNNGEGFFGLGPYFNLLPLVTIALFLVSMKMSMPEPTNEQAAMQQKMMKYMTVFMGLLFYKVASGLCIYFIASSIWGLGERRLLNKSKGEGGGAQEAVKPIAPPSRGPTNGGSNGFGGGSSRKKAEKARRKR